MKIILLILMFGFSAFGQIARPTYNPFNNGAMPFYGQNQMMPQNGYYNQYRPNNFAFPNNTNHPLNFHRPNNFGFQNNFQRPQQLFPQNQPQYFPQQNNWQQPQQTQPQQPTPQPAPLFTRRFHLNNGYLFGRPSLQYDPKSGKLQPWTRKNLR